MDNPSLANRVAQIRSLSHDEQGSTHWFEAANLAQVVLHDTVGGNHPLMAALKNALEKADPYRAVAASRGVIKLFEEGGLTSPRLAVAHEIEGDLLNLAQSQTEAAERAADLQRKHTHLAIAAFLAGAAVEDCLRRLCDAHGITYDAQRTSIAKLQSALFQPAPGRGDFIHGEQTVDRLGRYTEQGGPWSVCRSHPLRSSIHGHWCPRVP